MQMAFRNSTQYALNRKAGRCYGVVRRGRTSGPGIMGGSGFSVPWQMVAQRCVYRFQEAFGLLPLLPQIFGKFWTADRNAIPVTHPAGPRPRARNGHGRQTGYLWPDGKL